MASSSAIAGVTADSVQYLKEALLLRNEDEVSNAEAAAKFARMIQSSLKSWFTQVNFFLHNIAQLKFSSETDDCSVLSFVPKVYRLVQCSILIFFLIICLFVHIVKMWMVKSSTLKFWVIKNGMIPTNIMFIY